MTDRKSSGDNAPNAAHIGTKAFCQMGMRPLEVEWAESLAFFNIYARGLAFGAMSSISEWHEG